MANIKVNITINSNTKTELEIPKTASVDDLLRKISDLNGSPVENISISYAGVPLVSQRDGTQQLLSNYDIKDNSELTVNVVYRKELDEDVELSDLPDMITWDDDPESKRAKMPCGHAIGPESLTAYCRSLLTAGKYQFRCPYIDRENSSFCGRVWEYFIIRRLAVLSEDEKKEFETKLSQNYMRKASGIQECPKCTSFCIRENRKDRRVICLICSKDGDQFEFCWYCLGEWKTSGITKCGNPACAGEDPRLKILRNAVKKTIVGLRNCPSIRACPKCGILINHEKACKHMVCICGQKFCFICLKTAFDGNYRCGTYNSHCDIAPVQTSVPGDE